MLKGELVQELVHSGGLAIELKLHRSRVPSPSTVQTKCGTCPGATPEGCAELKGPFIDHRVREVINTT